MYTKHAQIALALVQRGRKMRNGVPDIYGQVERAGLHVESIWRVFHWRVFGECFIGECFTCHVGGLEHATGKGNRVLQTAPSRAALTSLEQADARGRGLWTSEVRDGRGEGWARLVDRQGSWTGKLVHPRVAGQVSELWAASFGQRTLGSELWAAGLVAEHCVCNIACACVKSLRPRFQSTISRVNRWCFCDHLQGAHWVQIHETNSFITLEALGTLVAA